MRVLVACEFSGVVRDAFLARGHDAVSCDLLPSESSAARHHRGDVLGILDQSWDLMIAHPPCTYLANSGQRSKHDPGRREKRNEALEFFRLLLDAPVPKIAIENPIPFRCTRAAIGKYSQIINPFQFGHPTRKATCLWLRGLPLLEPAKIVEPVPKGHYVRKTGERKGKKYRMYHHQAIGDRWKERSRTFPGIATAMADQWG